MKNKSLRKLGFLNTKLGSEGAVALAEVLADSWSITRIDIRENNIQTAGLMAFAMALKVNQTLLRLDLDKDIRKEPGSLLAGGGPPQATLVHLPLHKEVTVY